MYIIESNHEHNLGSIEKELELINSTPILELERELELKDLEQNELQ